MRATPKPYTPHREHGGDLDARTVGREPVLASLLHRFQVAGTVGTLQHTLLVGPRGSGKSHVIEVALHRLAQDADLAGRLRIARLPEDVIGITSFSDMLLSIVERLGLDDGVVANAREHRRRKEETVLEGLIVDALGDSLLVIVIENLDRLFGGIGEHGQRSFRSWVETSRRILVVATSPLLIEAVRSRDEPWYGSFVVDSLPGLSTDEATTLVAHLARQRGGDDVAEYVEGPEGRRRLATIQQLASGSPRLWTIFADVVTVPSLELVIPAVEDLLEGLVPYYQQRLWELPPNEQKVVMALATAGSAHAPAREVAERAGLEEGSAGVTLRRLEESGWVSSQKMPETDQRSTWYELREPLFRYYLQYRQGDTRTIRLILELLQAWFDPAIRTGRLLRAEPFSVDEQYLALSLQLERPYRSDHAYAHHDPHDLVTTGRLWIHEPGKALGTYEAAVVLEYIGIIATEGIKPARRSLHARTLDDEVIERLRMTVGEIGGSEGLGGIGRALHGAAALLSGTTSFVLRFIATCWDGYDDPGTAVHGLSDLLSSLPKGSPARLRLCVSAELGFFRGKAGQHTEAISTLEEVVERAEAFLGRDDVDTLVFRQTLGELYRAVDRINDAINLLEFLLDDQRRILGPDHLNTLSTQHSLGDTNHRGGRHFTAIDLLQTVIDERARLLGSDHPQTLASRLSLGSAYSNVRRHHEAISLVQSVVNDQVRLLGTDDLDTLISRLSLGLAYVEAGRHEDATITLRAVSSDLARVLGPDHHVTLSSRDILGFALDEAGLHDDAISLLDTIINDRIRVLGPDDPDTLHSRHRLGAYYSAAGRHDDAITLLQSVINDRTRLLGPEAPDTMTSRRILALAYNRGGHYDAAIDELRSIFPRGASTMQETALLFLARDRVHQGLQRSRQTVAAGDDDRELLIAVVRQRDAEAFARLPSEIRQILTM